jgi:hypothetical protein
MSNQAQVIEKNKESALIISLDQEHIAQFLKEHAEKQIDLIPEAVEHKIDTLVNISNYTAPRALIAAIKSFKNQEEAFQIWKDYAENGSETDLREALRAQPFSLVSEFNLQSMAFKEYNETQNYGFWKNNWLRRSITTAFNMGMSRMMMSTNAGLPQNKAILLGFMMNMHRVIDNELENTETYATPFYDIVKATDFKGRYMSDLPTLMAQENLPLVELTEEDVKTLKDQAITLAKDKFNQIWVETFAPQTTRHDLSTIEAEGQIPDIKFGVELEVTLLDSNKLIDKALLLWKSLQKADLPVQGMFNLIKTIAAPKADNNYSNWMIMRDSSVNNPLSYAQKLKSNAAIPEFDAVEIVSPVLQGTQGFRQFVTVVNSINGRDDENHFVLVQEKKKGQFRLIKSKASNEGYASIVASEMNRESKISCATNQSCGFHVHVELKDQPLDKLKNLCKALLKNESKFDSLVSDERRGNACKFAQSSTHVTAEQIDEAQDVRALVAVMNRGGDRNHKFDITNLANPSAPDTIQYRNNGGAAYLDTAKGYVAAVLNFTVSALDNPDLDLDNVLIELGAAPTSISQVIEVTPKSMTPSTVAPKLKP